MKNKTLRTFIAIYIALNLCLSTAAVAYAASKEALVKAAFIYNFTKFVAWPGDLGIASRSNISICIIGSNSLGDATGVFKQGSTASLTIDAKMISNAPAEKGECHIAFISASEKARVGSLLQSLKATSTLAVSDMEGFAESGGMVEFINEDNKVKLVVNRASTEQAGLKVDAQLLEIARKVIQ